MLFKKIEVKDYEIQTKISSYLFFILIFIWILIVSLFVLNRYTYTKKHIEIKYFNSNLSQNTIKAIIPANSVLKGDNFIIENYLAEYVKTRETILPNDFLSKDAYIQAFTDPNVISSYLKTSQYFRNRYPNFIRHVRIKKVVQLDDTLFQIHYVCNEKEDYKTSQEIKKYMISTVRYTISNISEHDLRRKIHNFDALNPLKITVVVYTTARRYS